MCISIIRESCFVSPDKIIFLSLENISYYFKLDILMGLYGAGSLTHFSWFPEKFNFRFTPGPASFFQASAAHC